MFTAGRAPIWLGDADLVAVLDGSECLTGSRYDAAAWYSATAFQSTTL